MTGEGWEMSGDSLAPGETEIAETDWPSVLEDTEESTALSYSEEFFERAEQAQEDGTQRTYRFLGHVTSMELDLDDPQHPFVSRKRWANGRTCNLGDLRDEELERISDFLNETEDSELQARLGDVLWVALKDHQGAEAAVTGYVESAKRLFDPEDWQESARRLERAFQLTNFLQNPGLHSDVADTVEDWLEDGGEFPWNLRYRLLYLLEEYSRRDREVIAERVQETAEGAEDAEEWRMAKSLWELDRRLQHQLGDPASAQDAQARMGEAKVEVAEEAVRDGDGSHAVAASHLVEAVDLFRQAGRTERAQQAHQRLLDYQKKGMGEMEVIEVEEEATEEVKAAQEYVSTSDPFDALQRLALIRPLPRVERLEASVQEMVEVRDLRGIMTQTILDDEGKPIAKRDSFLDDEAEEALQRAEMARQAQFSYAHIVQASIQPARAKILHDHRITRSNLLEVCSRSPFVPPSREAIYAKGLYRGLSGDFEAAIRLLVPEVEHLLRYLLAANDVITSSLREGGIQKEYSLGSVLEMEELEEILGPDLVFTLDAVLNSDHGANLRHRLAHGLLDQGQASTVAGVYAWWLVLHLVFRPFAIAEQQEGESNDDGER